MGWRRRVVIQPGLRAQRSGHLSGRGDMASRLKRPRPPAHSQPPAQGRDHHHPGKGQLPHRQRQKGRQRQDPQQVMVQGAGAHAPSSLQHQGRDRRLEPPKHRSHRAHLAEAHIDPGQCDQDEQGGQHEQHPCRHTAPGAVHQPAQVGGQLLGLGPWQQHAVVQRVQKPPLAEPAPARDDFIVHQRDLPRGPAKADEAQAPPECQGLPEGRS